MSRTVGVHCLDDIKARCRVDYETGCWVWAMAFIAPKGCVTPVTHFAPGVLGSPTKTNTLTAARAAWLLAGNTLPAGHVVWRHECHNMLCVNPAHLRAGTRQQMHSAIAATGRNRGKPERAACCARNRAKQLTPVDTVRKAEAMFAEGRLQKDVRAAFGMTGDTARRIRLGQHPHSAGRQQLVRGASVFALGGL